jgi:hypothetical protein
MVYIIKERKNKKKSKELLVTSPTRSFTVPLNSKNKKKKLEEEKKKRSKFAKFKKEKKTGERVVFDVENEFVCSNERCQKRFEKQRAYCQAIVNRLSELHDIINSYEREAEEEYSGFKEEMDDEFKKLLELSK